MCWQDGKWVNCNEKHENRQQNTLPPLWKQGVNYAKAQIASTMGFTVDATIEHQKKRLEVCANCEKLFRYNALPMGADVGLNDRCSDCGCFVVNKVKKYGVKSWACPNGKWQDIDEKYEKEAIK